jgi:uncharacterized membrane protein YoaK (UPF0700 family)
LEYKAIYQHYQGNGLPFQCSGRVQNSMVTQISNSIVRTTHDSLYRFRIELSQLFFYAKRTKKLSASIYLRLSIIILFLLAVSGGFLYLPGNKDAICRCLFPSNSTYLLLYPTAVSCKKREEISLA